jgi:hypothetical protein
MTLRPRLAVRMLAASVFLAASLVGWPAGLAAPRPQGTDPGVLGVAGRQVAWLNFAAPRPRPVSMLPAGSNALELTALADAAQLVVAAGAPFPGGGARGADLLSVDAASGAASTLLGRADARESLNAPAWWSDHATLLFERQDLAGQPVGAPGQEVPRYPTRIERVMADGSDRQVLVAEGRQPAPAPDGSQLAFARTTNLGAALLRWSIADGAITTIVPEGRFADVAYPQFSPDSSWIAFVAPQSGLAAGAPPGRGLDLGTWLRPGVAAAHGIPWDPWLVHADGSGLRRLAETGADEPSVTWSPSGRELFVYSGTGSFVVDAATGEVTPFAFVQGYGPTVWLTD